MKAILVSNWLGRSLTVAVRCRGRSTEPRASASGFAVAGAILFGLFAGVLSAHDLATSVEISPQSVIARTSYAGEEPAAYAQVLVYGPGDSTREFQNGGTDANGVFSFVPDRDGEWLLVVDDGMGHRAEVKVQINRGGEGPAASPATNLSAGQKLLTGVSFILGFTGLLAWLRVRRLSMPGPRP